MRASLSSTARISWDGARTADLIRRQGLDRWPLLGYREPPAAAVALPLGRPLYAPSREVFATHTDWGPRQRDMTLQELRCAARQLARRQGLDVVLVINQQLPPWGEILAIGSRVDAIVRTEEFYLYRLRRSSLASTVGEAACSLEAP